MILKIIARTPAFSLASIFLFASCATIVSKSTYPVSIRSNPTDAVISITDKKGKKIYLGTMPAIVYLKAGAGYFSRAEYQVKFSSLGYDDKIVPILCNIDGWYFGNILIGGLIGVLIVDPATGAMWRIETKFINETLGNYTVSLDPELKILDINNIPEEWKAHLIKLEEK